MTDPKGLKGKKLGEILQELGVIDALQLQAAMAHHQQWGMSLGKALVEKRLCTEADVLRALSLQCALPAVDLDEAPLDPRLVFVLPVKSAERLQAVPLRLEGKRHEILVVATAPPLDLTKLDTLRSVSGKQKVSPLIATDSAIERAIATLYYGKPREKAAPPESPLSNAVAPSNELQFDLESEDTEVAVPAAAPAAQPKPAPAPAPVPTPAAPASAANPPVLLYGWNEAGARSLAQTLRSVRLDAKVISEAEMESVSPDAVVLTSTLALQALFPAGARAPGTLIVCGMPQDADAVDARAIGAKMYLRPPFSSEQLRAAVARCRARPPAGKAG